MLYIHKALTKCGVEVFEVEIPRLKTQLFEAIDFYLLQRKTNSIF